MDKRKRNIQMKFYVDKKELEQINRRVRLANMTNRGAYLRKMAIDGFVVNVDTSDLKAVVKEMNAIGKNINQITRNTNTYGIMKQDVEAIKTKVDKIWQLLKYMRTAKKGGRPQVGVCEANVLSVSNTLSASQ